MYKKVETPRYGDGEWTRLHGYPPSQCGKDDRDNWNYTSEHTKLHTDTLNDPILAPDSLWAAWAEVGKYTRGVDILTLMPDSLWAVWADTRGLYTPRLSEIDRRCELQPYKAWL